jgi:zinc transport system substrate-binding protein
MKKSIIFSILLIILSAFLSGCNESNLDTTKDGKFTVYTTVYPLQYFTERIGGDLVNVKTIYPPGADEHIFEPSQRDMMALADSQIFFYIGLGLEGFVEKAKSTLKSEEVQFISLGESVNFQDASVEHDEGSEHEEEEHHEDSEHDDHSEHEEDSTEEHNHGDIDPHVWLDPSYSKEMALAIKNALIAELPEKEKTFEENYLKLEKELEELNSAFQSTIDSAKHKDIIVSHAAFGYWEERYGLNQISISGISSANEPSQKDLEKIVKIAKEKKLSYILFEQNVSSKLAEIIQKEIKAKPLTLHNLSTLTNEDIKNNETYFSLMNRNIKALSTALNE